MTPATHALRRCGRGLWLALAIVLAACAQSKLPATQVIVAITSDLAPAEELSRIEVSLSQRDGSNATDTRAFPLSADPKPGQYALPITFAVAKGKQDTFLLTVTGYGPGEDGSTSAIVEQKTIATFLPRATLLVRVFLARVCLRKTCDDPSEQVCYPTETGKVMAGDCGEIVVHDESNSERIDPKKLPDLAAPMNGGDGGLPPVMRDGGTAGSGSGQGGTGQRDATTGVGANGGAGGSMEMTDASPGTTTTDSGPTDSGMTDSGPMDSGPMDSGMTDSGASGSGGSGGSSGSGGSGGSSGSGGSGGSSGSGGSGGTGGTGESAFTDFAIATSGTACTLADEKGCTDHDVASTLLCTGSPLTWELATPCTSGNRCDTKVGATQGTCQPIPAACVNKSPDDFVCTGTDRGRCDADRLHVLPAPCPSHQHCQGTTTVSCACDAQYRSDGSGGCIAGPPCIGGGSEVVLIGDSYCNYAIAHTDMAVLLATRARNDGALAVGQNYRDLCVAGTSLSAIVSQWSSAKGTLPIDLVIMNGGFNDFQIDHAECLPAGKQNDASCKQLADGLVVTASSLWTDMKAAGVHHVIYSWYPHLVDGGGDDIRDYMAQQLGVAALAASGPTFQVHLVDPVAAFAGHSEYISADGIHANTTGSNVIADLIWTWAKSQCVGQAQASGCCLP